MLKALITDLDRTLLRNDKSISKYTIETLKTCRNKGILLIAATARPARAISYYDELINFDATVTLNGAVISQKNNAEKVYILKEDVEHILRKLQSLNDCIISLETSIGLYSNVDIPEWKPIICEDLLTIPVLDEVYKILVSSTKQDLSAGLNEILSKNVYFSLANGDLFQIMNSRATKWNGINTLLEINNISPEDIIYFGDDYDDIEPIKRSGTGIAVSNAIEEVKCIADYIIDSNENDGVAKYISKNILNKSPI